MALITQYKLMLKNCKKMLLKPALAEIWRVDRACSFVIFHSLFFLLLRYEFIKFTVGTYVFRIKMFFFVVFLIRKNKWPHNLCWYVHKVFFFWSEWNNKLPSNKTCSEIKKFTFDMLIYSVTTSFFKVLNEMKEVKVQWER